MAALVALVVGAAPAAAGHDESYHSRNMRLLAEAAIETGLPGSLSRGDGSDLAFQGSLVVAGAYQGVGLFRILPKRPYLEQISFFLCPGAQSDVSVWGDYVFQSVEAQSGASAFYLGANALVSPTCNTTVGAAGMEGIRIIDISDVENPREVNFIPFPGCGSHTHTLLPHKDKLYIYNSHLPNWYLEAYAPRSRICARLPIVEMPKDDPSAARVVAEPSLDLETGCHDITVFPAKKLAAAACWTESMLLDITDPADPKVVSHFETEWPDGHHSTAFSWDGRYVALGHEMPSCRPGSTTGGMALFDVSDRKKPKRVGSYSLPRPPGGSFCWTHNFSTVPMKDPRRHVITAGYYNGGVSVVDVSDPKRPRELGFYVPRPDGREPQIWGAYWYQGRIYTNDWLTGRGVSVFELQGLSLKEAKAFKARYNPQVQLLEFR